MGCDSRHRARVLGIYHHCTGGDRHRVLRMSARPQWRSLQQIRRSRWWLLFQWIQGENLSIIIGCANVRDIGFSAHCSQNLTEQVFRVFFHFAEHGQIWKNSTHHGSRLQTALRDSPRRLSRFHGQRERHEHAQSQHVPLASEQWMARL